ncbi:MAG: hypothetical protein GX974_00210 [Clostridiales bacterium]|nr:hypothetical protein [Clostridiales bacterium]
MGIQNLIDAATPGSTVDVQPGVYNEQLVIDKALILQGPSPGGGAAIIDATGLNNISAIQILSDDVTVSRLTIQNGSLHGIQAGNASYPNLSDITISDNHIKGHANAGILTNSGASMIIKNNIIENNGLGAGFNRNGIVLYPHGTTDIINNTIVNNAVDGIFARASSSGLRIENNEIKGQANSGISLAWDQRNTSIINNKIKDCGTGNFDEEGGIVIIQSMAEVIQGNTIENCKQSGIFWGWVPTTGSSPTEILISDNEIKNSSRDAIYLFSQGTDGPISPDLFPLEPKIIGNNLRDNGRAGVYISNAYYYGPGNANPTINENQIVGNAWGVFNATAQVVDATNNWWGSSSGPYQPLLNPQGKGDQVSDNVDFTPWQTKAPTIEIIGCFVRNVSLESFNILSSIGETSRIVSIFKVVGDITIDINGNLIVKNFEISFAKSLAMKVPKTITVTPAITATSECYADLNDNAIQISVDLCIVISILGKCTLAVPTLDTCLIPRKANSLNVKKDLSEIKHCKEETNSIECVNAEKVFDFYQFNKIVTHSIDI